MSKAISILPTVARLLVGLTFTVFGLNGFLHFLPMPPPPAAAASLFGALAASGYLMPLIFGTQLAVGVLLLAGVFVPLALVLLAPVMVHILAFHIFLAPAGLPLPLLLLVLGIYLAWSYRDAFAPMLHAHTTPRPEARPAPRRAIPAT